MESPILPSVLPQKIVKTSPPQTPHRFHQPPFNNPPAIRFHPSPTYHTPPSHTTDSKFSSPPQSSNLLSPFQFQPRTSQTPASPSPINISTTPPPNLENAHPIEILHMYNLLYSVPAMPPNHNMVLELHQQPLEPQIQLEHDLRIISINGWYERGGKPHEFFDWEAQGKIWKEEMEARGEKEDVDGFQWQFNEMQRQREQERVEEEECEKMKAPVPQRGINGHVCGGKVVKPSCVMSIGSPSLPVRPSAVTKAVRAGNGVTSPARLPANFVADHQIMVMEKKAIDEEGNWQRGAETKNIDNKGIAGAVIGQGIDVGADTSSPSSHPLNGHNPVSPQLQGGNASRIVQQPMSGVQGTSAGPRPLLGQIPATTTPKGADMEPKDNMKFELGPWEEIGRQWAKKRPGRQR